MATILVIDDQPEIRRILRRVLEKDPDFQVIEAEDGQSALESLDEEPPDAVILDLSMPGLNGIQTIRPLVSRAPAAKVIILSSHFEMGEELKAMGAHAFLPKHVKAKEILGTVRQLLSEGSE